MADEEKKLDKNQDAEAENDKPNILSKTILIYGVAIMLSFFASIVILYFAMIRNQNADKQANTAIEANDGSQPTASDDSTKKSEKVHTIVVDSIPKDNLLSPKDKIKILELENMQRQKEIDHLWTMMKELDAEQKKIAAEDSVANLQAARVAKTKSDSGEKVPPTLEKKFLADSNLIQAQREAAISSSAKIYSSMKPAKAAVILEGFEANIAAKILLTMRQRQSAKILEAMKPAQAARVCQVMVLGKKNNKEKS